MLPSGVILLAHGARDPSGPERFEAFRTDFAGLAPEVPVALAFLGFMSPDLAGAALASARH